MEFGRNNGHFDVPRPKGTEKNDEHMSEERKLYNWVESLHSQYRSYKLGRQAGSLTDDRVLLLVKQGFTFRNS
jgi:hypothetical protein